MAQTVGLILATFGFSYLSNKYGDSLFLKFTAGVSGMGLIAQVIRQGVKEFLYEKQQNKTPTTEQVVELPSKIPIVKEEESFKKPSDPPGAFENLSGEELMRIDKDFGRPKKTRKRKKSK